MATTKDYALQSVTLTTVSTFIGYMYMQGLAMELDELRRRGYSLYSNLQPLKDLRDVRSVFEVKSALAHVYSMQSSF